MDDDERIRAENITCFLQGDRVWPPNWICHEGSRRFAKSLREVFRRLNDDVYCEVDELWFVLDTGELLALNVPRDILCLPSSSLYTRSYDTIFILKCAWQLSDMALVGLLAHEIAHSFAHRQTHSENEDAADALVSEWGFTAELDALKAELKPLGTVGQ